MSIQQDSLNKIQLIFNRLTSEAKTMTTSSMLSNINEACKKIDTSKGTVSYSTVIKVLANVGVIIKKQTLYNDRDGCNPYRVLIQAWMEHSSLTNNIGVSNNIKKISTPEQLIDDNDLSKIPDLTLRHKVSLMLGEVKGLQNQLNTMREIRSLPMLTLSKPLAELDQFQSATLALNEYDIDLLRALLSDSKSKSIGFNEEDELVAKRAIKRDEVLSHIGLKSTLEKIINLHTPTGL